MMVIMTIRMTADEGDEKIHNGDYDDKNDYADDSDEKIHDDDSDDKNDCR